MQLLKRGALRTVVEMLQGIEIELELAVDRLAPSLRLEHLHRLGMRHLAQRIDRERLLAMRERGRVVAAFEIDPRRVALHLEEHVTQPITLAPAPVALPVIGIFDGDVFEQVPGVETVGRLQTDQRLVAGAGLDVSLGLAAELLEGRYVEPAAFRRHQHVA